MPTVEKLELVRQIAAIEKSAQCPADRRHKYWNSVKYRISILIVSYFYHWLICYLFLPSMFPNLFWALTAFFIVRALMMVPLIARLDRNLPTHSLQKLRGKVGEQIVRGIIWTAFFAALSLLIGDLSSFAPSAIGTLVGFCDHNHSSRVGGNPKESEGYSIMEILRGKRKEKILIEL
jgi:hypothetical protein